MLRFVPILAICVLGAFLAGCPDLYPRVRDVEFENWRLVERPAERPYARSPVTFPDGFASKPRRSGDHTVTDPVLAKALLAKTSPPATVRPRTTASFTVYQGPVVPWSDDDLGRYARPKIVRWGYPPAHGARPHPYPCPRPPGWGPVRAGRGAGSPSPVLRPSGTTPSGWGSDEARARAMR